MKARTSNSGDTVKGRAFDVLGVGNAWITLIGTLAISHRLML